jgi:hypothetical protein
MRGTRIGSFKLMLGLGIALMSTPALAVEHVDLKLVLATDVSGSISNDELWLERRGTAAAFLYPDVIRAIEGGALGRIAVAMIDFSSPGFGKTVIEWRIIDDRASASEFAQAILKVPRTPGNRTSISNALELGAELIRSSKNEIVATRSVIDVAGDGPNNDGQSLAAIRERVLARGIAVNGLAIMDENANGYFPGLAKYYQGCVAGGRGAFVIAVHSFMDFGAAMRRKLIREISQNENGFKLTQNQLLFAAAAPEISPLLPPERNGYSSVCNMRDNPASK